MTMTDSRSARFTRREAIRLLGIGAGLRSVTVLTAGMGAQGPLPRGAIIRTVLADVPPGALGKGATLFHEHLREPSLDVLVEELKATGKDGVSCMVDAYSGDTSPGRVDKLRTLARGSGMHIVVAGGHYVQRNYPPDIATKTADQIVDDYGRAAAAERWGALGEIGTSSRMTADERKVLTAVGKFHVRSGLPIFTHTSYHPQTGWEGGCEDGAAGKCALDQLDVFEAQGVDPRRVCIGHLSDLEEPTRAETFKALAKRGAYLGFDTVGRPSFPGTARSLPDATKVAMILEVLEAGHEDHVLLSHDSIRLPMLKSTGGAGFSTIVSVFIPKLRYAGVKDATIQKFLVDNPRRFLAFVPKQT